MPCRSGAKCGDWTCYECNEHNKCKKHCKTGCHRCCRNYMLYGLGAWADNRVVSITYIPVCGTSIVWSVANNSLTPSAPTNTNNWNEQTMVSALFFPMKIRTGDRFEFVYHNDADAFNAIACAANIDGNLHKTWKPSVGHQPYEIYLAAKTVGSVVIDPLYSPVTDIATRNIVDTPNYVAVSPNVSGGDITVVWTVV